MKAYADYTRPILKPVAGGVLAALDGTPTSAFSIDENTGVITFDAAPGADVAVSAGFLFDTPVRFDIDRLELSFEGFGAGRAPSVPLLEILI